MENEPQLARDNMVSSVSTPEFELKAFNQIVTALTALPKETMPRVLGSVMTFLGITERPFNPVREPNSLGAAAGSSPSAAASTFSEDRTPSPKEFMMEKRPTTDIERVACLAYFLTHYRNTPHFKTLDLSKLNTDAAQIKLSNASVAVDNASSAGLLVQAGKGNKQISAIGELYVQMLPDREAAKAAIAHARPRRKSKRGGTPTEDESEDTNTKRS